MHLRDLSLASYASFTTSRGVILGGKGRSKTAKRFLKYSLGIVRHLLCRGVEPRMNTLGAKAARAFWDVIANTAPKQIV